MNVRVNIDPPFDARPQSMPLTGFKDVVEFSKSMVWDVPPTPPSNEVLGMVAHTTVMRLAAVVGLGRAGVTEQQAHQDSRIIQALSLHFGWNQVKTDAKAYAAKAVFNYVFGTNFRKLKFVDQFGNPADPYNFLAPAEGFAADWDDMVLQRIENLEERRVCVD